MNENKGMFKDQVEVSTRREGVYWTPLDWVAEMHNFMDGLYGSEWADETLIWDPCCGGGNLTRGLNPAYMIQTTLGQKDINSLGGELQGEFRVRQEYDFLNDLIIPAHIDKMLKRASANKIPVLFLMNPPYVTPGKTAVRLDTSKKGATDTLVKGFMGGIYGCDQMFLQFLWRALIICREYKLQYRIGLFSATTYLLRNSFDALRDILFTNVKFRDGFVFPSNHFEAITTKWMVLFAVYERNSKTPSPIEFNWHVKDRNRDGKIETIQKRKYYRLDKNKSMINWIKAVSRGASSGDNVPCMTTGIRTKPRVSKLPKDAFGFFTFNNMYLQERDNTYFTSSASAANRGVAILPSNFWRFIAGFSVMRLLNKNWATEKDEIHIPNTHDRMYREWCYNALVYMLFNKQNNSSGNTVDWEGEIWRLHNHMFWMEKSHVKSMWPDLDFDEPKYNHKVNRPYYQENSVPWTVLKLAEASESNMLWPESKVLLKNFLGLMDGMYRVRLSDHKIVQWRRWDAGYFQLRSMFYSCPGWDKILIPSRQSLQARLISYIDRLGFFGVYGPGVLKIAYDRLSVEPVGR
jgi:hypothetical protein